MFGGALHRRTRRASQEFNAEVSEKNGLLMEQPLRSTRVTTRTISTTPAHILCPATFAARRPLPRMGCGASLSRFARRAAVTSAPRARGHLRHRRGARSLPARLLSDGACPGRVSPQPQPPKSTTVYFKIFSRCNVPSHDTRAHLRCAEPTTRRRCCPSRSYSYHVYTPCSTLPLSPLHARLPPREARTVPQP